MVVPYTFNGNCYILTNFAGSNNPFFTNQEEIDNFKGRIEKNIGELVEILGWSFRSDHYQIMVSLRQREVFEMFYREKRDDLNIVEESIPESTYILSQEMANIQSGYAKWFNHRHERYGSLFGRRYTKILLESKEAVKEAVDKINEGNAIWEFTQLWSYLWNFVKERKVFKDFRDTSLMMYEGSGTRIKCWFSNFLSFEDWDLRGNYVPIGLDFKN